MRLIDDLRAEHEVIEQVAGSLRCFARARLRGEGDAADGAPFVAFFRLYAGHFHHAREEDTLLLALQRDAELPGDRGPIAVMLADHRRMADLLDRLAAVIGLDPPEGADRTTLESLALEYSELLWHHIDAENSVLFPESESRLRRHGVGELSSREMTSAEAAARAAGLALVAAYPPGPEPEVMRGEGCVMCPAFVDSCRGLEHEWWNEWEWEEFDDHLPSA